MKLLKNNNHKILYFYFTLFFIFQIIAESAYHVPGIDVQTRAQINFLQTKQNNKESFRSQVPYNYPELSRRYIPSVAECKKLSSAQIRNCLERECGGSIEQYHERILKLYPYYKSNSFIAVVKEFPGYAAFVCATARKIRKKFLFKIYMKLHGVQSIFERLEKEVLKQQELERKAAPSRRVMESQKSALQELQHEYLLRPCQSKLLQQKRQERLCVLNEYFSGNQTCRELTYALSSQSQQLISQSGAVLPQKLVCLGNGLQQQAYQECVDSINMLSNCTKTRTITNLDRLILELSSLGLQSASSGLIKQTYAITDFCWSAIDHLQAAGEGVCDGFVNVAHMIVHPIDTVLGAAKGLYEVGSFLGKLLYEVGDIAITGCYDVELAQEKSDQFFGNIFAITDAIAEKLKNIPSRDYVRMGVGFVTESILCAQLLHASQRFYKASKTKALQYLENPSSRVVVTTAEGIEFEITAHASDAIFEQSGVQEFAKNKKNVGGSRPEVITAYRTIDFLETTELGKQLKNFCVDIKRQYKKMDIYQITERVNINGVIYHKGDYFYVDRFHKDHLEFFYKDGSFYRVINLDGSINFKKTQMASRKNRSIKKVIS